MGDHGDGTRLPGEETRNLRRHDDTEGQKNQQQEMLTQRRGNRYLATGWAVIVATLLLNLSTVVIYRDQPFPNQQAKLFANLAFVTLMVLGAACVSVGLIERMLRGNRARQIAGAAIAYDRGEQAVILLKRNIVNAQEDQKATQRQLDVIMGMLGTAVRRLDAIDKVIDKVPAYGEGVIQGVTLGRDSIVPGD